MGESQKIRDARAQLLQTESDYHEEHGPDAPQIVQTLQTCTAIVAKTAFAEQLVATVASWCAVVPSNDAIDIVCYGIGRVRSSRTAQHQAGMLLAMMEHPAITDVLLYDPCLHHSESDALELLGCQMITNNEKGVR